MAAIVLGIVEVVRVHKGTVSGEVVNHGVAKDGAQGGKVVGMELLPLECRSDNKLQSRMVTPAKVVYFLELSALLRTYHGVVSVDFGPPFHGFAPVRLPPKGLAHGADVMLLI